MIGRYVLTFISVFMLIHVLSTRVRKIPAAFSRFLVMRDLNRVLKLSEQLTKYTIVRYRAMYNLYAQVDARVNNMDIETILQNLSGLIFIRTVGSVMMRIPTVTRTFVSDIRNMALHEVGEALYANTLGDVLDYEGYLNRIVDIRHVDLISHYRYGDLVAGFTYEFTDGNVETSKCSNMMLNRMANYIVLNDFLNDIQEVGVKLTDSVLINFLTRIGVDINGICLEDEKQLDTREAEVST